MKKNKDTICLMGLLSLIIGLLLSWLYVPFFYIGFIIYGISGFVAGKIFWIDEQKNEWVVRILSGIAILFGSISQ